MKTPFTSGFGVGYNCPFVGTVSKFRPFAANTWSYPAEPTAGVIPPEILESLSSLESRLGSQNCGQLATLLTRFGGKAVSLPMCELIAQHCPNQMLKVPRWIGVPQSSSTDSETLQSISAWLKAAGPGIGYCLRSSEFEEDWIDPRSGVMQSEMFRSGALTAEQVLSAANKSPKVLQHHAGFGTVGMVVDVAYSPILKRVVMRLAHGRIPKLGLPTSPTWDYESLLTVVDFDTGEVIIPNHSISAEIVECFRKCIYVGMMKIGMAAQFEVYYLPGRLLDSGFNLVQMRPLPEKLRGLDDLVELPRALPNFYSLQVNRSGDLTSELELVDRDLQSDLAYRIDDSAYRASSPGRFSGKAIVWPSRASKSTPFNHLAAGETEGAVVQFCKGPIICADFHGSPMQVAKDAQKRGGREFALFQRVANSTNLHIGLDINKHQDLTDLMHRTRELRVRVISDGLVAGIWVL